MGNEWGGWSGIIKLEKEDGEFLLWVAPRRLCQSMSFDTHYFMIDAFHTTSIAPQLWLSVLNARNVPRSN